MYDAIGIASFLRFALYVNAALAIALGTDFWGVLPDIPYASAASISVIGVSALLFLVGQTRLFPRACRLPLMWRIFPNIEGEYEVEISSNWSAIKARTEGNEPETSVDGSVVLFTKMGKAKIIARLTRIDIRIEMYDEYLSSETIVCSLRRERGERLPTLFYIYDSLVSVPKSTDSERHLGAARVSIPLERHPTVLEGHYWTNRNWHQALNTAGRIKYRRL